MMRNNAMTGGSEKPNPKRDFEMMTELFLKNNNVSNSGKKVGEMEVRFGTNTALSKPLSKIDYDNVVRRLMSAGFVCDNMSGTHILRIQNQYSEKDGVLKMSNIRAEIPGIDLVQEYCRTNSISKLIDMTSSISAISDKIKFTRKTPPIVPGEDKPIRIVDFPDFNFRVSYQNEEDFDVRTPTAQKIIKDWNNALKTFRLINRVRFSHPIYPIFADISIIRSSTKTNKVAIPRYTMQESGVMTNQETFEVELEIDNSRVGFGTDTNTTELLLASIRKMIRIVLGGIQVSNYPISFSERDAVLQQYMKVVHGDVVKEERRIANKHFIGPSSYTLQLENIIPQDVDSNIPNIRGEYTVTDKADGERRLLFVSNNGRIYMIDSNMAVVMSGYSSDNVLTHNSIIDGEFIRYNKKGDTINLYAAFDIYYVNNKSVRELGFVSSEIDDLKDSYRHPILIKCISSLNIKSILDTNDPTYNSCHFRLQMKTFYQGGASRSIFEGCNKILSSVKNGLFEYNTDGLIFTPSNVGVGGDKPGATGPKSKSTWDMSFKWKPPAFNTIDFLVSVKKNKKGQDDISTLFCEGLNMEGLQNIVQYKTLILRCGFDTKKHGYVNPFMDMVNGKIPKHQDIENEETYLPVPFHPTTPYDPNAQYCNIALKDLGNGNLSMTTEENEYFEEDMIVEFKYDMNDPDKKGFWHWTPIRVRYDKTSELRAGMKNYGNAYHVANSNWNSIHNPITEDMISGGVGIPNYSLENDVYYNKTNSGTSTRSLRDFHNLFVKRKLIMGVSQRNDTLIDYAVGKAGDLPKWIGAKLKFVFGIDVSRDNIQNKLDGACARYLTSRKKHREMPSALFVTGTSGANIRDGSAFDTISSKDNEITRAIFGEGKKDRVSLGEGVYDQYGVAKTGFQISSVQFAIHYFFENKTVLNQFMKNISECTKVGGYFIGTGYDGKRVFELLKKKNENDSIVVVRNEKKMYEITKRYAQTGFPSDENSLGYAIDIYQDSINKTFREYLVNFEYLTRILENYGFVIVSDAEANTMGLPKGSALFSELFDSMMGEVNRNPRAGTDYGHSMNMTLDEKMISFMNRYFIFRKERNVDTEAIFKILQKSRREKSEIEEIESMSKNKTTISVKTKRRKLKVPGITITESPEDEWRILESYPGYEERVNIEEESAIIPISETLPVNTVIRIPKKVKK